MAAVAEAARNVACTGARPLALTNCLNFGNPEKPEIMWEFAEATRGLGDAARALDTPVVSGNVSFYNETSGRAIHPTPTIAVVGILEDYERYAVSHFPEAGLRVVLFGESREEYGGSEWLALRRGKEAGFPPSVDLDAEGCLHELLRSGVARGLVSSAHDVSNGGLSVAAAECTFTAGDQGPQIGATLALRDTIRPDALLFGESTGRVIATTKSPQELLALARDLGVPARDVGETGGEHLRIGPGGGALWSPGGGALWIDIPVSTLRETWARAIPRRLEVA